MTATCRSCDVSLPPRQPGQRGRPPIYCAEHSARPRTAKPAAEMTCPECGDVFMGYPGATYCSRLCGHRAFHARRVADGRWDHQKAMRRLNKGQHPCVDCGKGIWTGERCRECYRGAVKAKRRVPATDRRATYERDGWICKLCGDPVARDKAVPHPLAPTIDHRIPLAECIRRFGLDYVDGMHNWQTAHYRCNCRKGKKETV